MDKDINNNVHYNDVDKNIESAFYLCQKEFTHLELLNMLHNGSISEKQIAALKFDCILDSNDVTSLLDNLTGCDGKIREAVAFKINSLISNNTNIRSLFAQNSAEIFADATIDINANICRLVLDSAELLKPYNDFTRIYTNKIIEFTYQALNELDKFIFRDKKYVINKQIFKLYWCLEALCLFYDVIDDDILKNILKKCILQNEYTIREKAAEIIKLSGKFSDLKETLNDDVNYYVRQILHQQSIFQKV